MLVCVFRDLPLHKGEIITLLKRVDENWYEGFCNGHQGFLPANYIEVGISSIYLVGLGSHASNRCIKTSTHLNKSPLAL